MKIYRGERFHDGVEVYVRADHGKSYPLSGAFGIRNHSPSGFEWGYRGSGPGQLALAILADHFGPAEPPKRCPFCDGPMVGWKCQRTYCAYDGEVLKDKWAHIQGGLVHYMDFKFDVIAKLPKERWELTSDHIQAWVDAQKLSFPAGAPKSGPEAGALPQEA